MILSPESSVKSCYHLSHDEKKHIIKSDVMGVKNVSLFQ